MNWNKFLLLPHKQRLAILKDFISREKELYSIEKADLHLNCPYCSSEKAVLNGRDKEGKQRFKCKHCGKSYGVNTGTSYHSLKKRKEFDMYIPKLFEGYKPLRKIADECNVSIVTAFEWRHRILSGLDINEQKVEGVIEYEIIEMPFSIKGFKAMSKNRGIHAKEELPHCNILLTTDYYPNYSQTYNLVSVGDLEERHIPKGFVNQLLEKENYPIIKKHSVLIEIVKRNGLTGKTTYMDEIPVNDRLDEINLQEMTNRFNGFIEGKMHGIASKYFRSYAVWLGFIGEHAIRKKRDIPDLRKSNQAWKNYIFQEASFKKFMESDSRVAFHYLSRRQWKSQNKFLN